MNITILSATLFSMLAAQPVTVVVPAKESAFTSTHIRDLTCVATFAIIASEQVRGDPKMLAYPPMSIKGKYYTANTGLRITKETGKSKEAVREAILKELATLQAAHAKSADPDIVIADSMRKCLPLLEVEVPQKPQPTLPECAALVGFAYDEMYKSEGLSKSARDLKTIASVLDNRAREAMLADGKSGNERDIAMIDSKFAVTAKLKASESGADVSELNMDYCFSLAAPKPKTPGEH